MAKIICIDDNGEIEVEGVSNWYLGDTYADSFLRLHITKASSIEEILLNDTTLEIHLEIGELVRLTVSLLGAVVEVATAQKVTLQDIAACINEYVSNHSPTEGMKHPQTIAEKLAEEDRTQ